MSRICQFSRDARQMRYGKKFATKLEMDTHSHATHVPGVRAHSRALLLGSKLKAKANRSTHSSHPLFTTGCGTVGRTAIS